jgi:hypothetical protein
MPSFLGSMNKLFFSSSENGKSIFSSKSDLAWKAKKNERKKMKLNINELARRKKKVWK